MPLMPSSSTHMPTNIAVARPPTSLFSSDDTAQPKRTQVSRLMRTDGSAIDAPAGT